jgi:hypothetical protein
MKDLGVSVGRAQKNGMRLIWKRPIIDVITAAG